MKNVKKVLSILLAVMTFLTVFAGCGKEVLPKGITPIEDAKVGDKVMLGSYEQDNNTKNGKERITWIVLAVEKGKALLVSEKVLDTKPYNNEKKDMTWEKCSLRTWLNDGFINDSFTKKEKRKIAEMTIKNPNNAQYKTPGGKDTKDKVFLLSMDEAKQYFKTDKDRRAKGTLFAKNNGLRLDESILYAGTSVWLLRSPGFKAYHICYVNNDGIIYNTLDVSLKNFGIRPAMWVKQ